MFALLAFRANPSAVSKSARASSLSPNWHCQSKIADLSYSTEDRELGRPELTPLGKCSGAVELEIVP